MSVINVRGRDVTIEETTVETNGQPARQLVATVGSTVVRKRVTFGAEDGSRPPLDLEILQETIDAERLELATDAAWREDLRELLEQVS